MAAPTISSPTFNPGHTFRPSSPHSTWSDTSSIHETKHRTLTPSICSNSHGFSHHNTPNITPASNSPIPTFLNYTRIGLRILSTFFAALTLGLIAANLHTYNVTRTRYLIYAGILVWGNEKEVDVNAAEVLQGGAAACLVLAGGLLLAGAVVPRLRKIGKLGDIATGVVASVNLLLALAVGAWVQNYEETDHPISTLMRWTCANRVIQHHDVNFRTICKQVSAAEKMLFAVVAVEVLVLVNVAVAGWSVRKNRQEVGRVYFRSRV